MSITKTFASATKYGQLSTASNTIVTNPPKVSSITVISSIDNVYFSTDNIIYRKDPRITIAQASVNHTLYIKIYGDVTKASTTDSFIFRVEDEDGITDTEVIVVYTVSETYETVPAIVNHTAPIEIGNKTLVGSLTFDIDETAGYDMLREAVGSVSHGLTFITEKSGVFSAETTNIPEEIGNSDTILHVYATPTVEETADFYINGVFSKHSTITDSGSVVLTDSGGNNITER